MNRYHTPLILRTILGIALLTLTLGFVPPEIDIWRKVLLGIVSVTLGFHIAAALQATATKGQIWAECLAFPMVMLGLLTVPLPMGWVLLAAGVCWRPMVSQVM